MVHFVDETPLCNLKNESESFNFLQRSMNCVIHKLNNKKLLKKKPVTKPHSQPFPDIYSNHPPPIVNRLKSRIYENESSSL